MFEWKVEEMKLMDKDSSFCDGAGSYTTRVFKCESLVSREDKIAFVDSMQEGKLSYILFLSEKFNAEKENLPHKESVWGGRDVKTVSLKAWLKRNDTGYNHRMVDDEYKYGHISFLRCDRYIQHDLNKKGMYDYYDDYVDECFHRQLLQCWQEEQRYFLSHDEASVLEKKIDDMYDRHKTSFGLQLLYGSNGIRLSDRNGGERRLTIAEMKELISKYEQLETFIEKLTAEMHISF